MWRNPPQSCSFLAIVFFEKQGIFDRIFHFEKTNSPSGDFSPEKKSLLRTSGNKTLESGFSPMTSSRLTPLRPNKSYLHLAQYRYQSWSTDDKAYHKKVFRIPCRDHREELEFPHANMKWFVRQWENTTVPLLDNAKTRIKHWNIGPMIFPSLCFVNSALIRQKFLLFSLQERQKSLLYICLRTSCRCLATSQFEAFALLTTFRQVWLQSC